MTKPLFADIRVRVDNHGRMSRLDAYSHYKNDLPKLLEAIDVMQKCLEFYARAGGLEATGTLERVRKLSEGDK